MMVIPLVVGVAALFLYLLGIVPSHIQVPPGVREFATMEEAQAKLGFKIILPAYFPGYLGWPPARITGEVAPVPQAWTLFVSPDHRTEVLLITQVAARDQSLSPSLPWIETVLEEMLISVGENPGELFVGRGKDGRLINGARWKMNDFQFTVVTTQPVQELLNLARSMHS